MKQKVTLEEALPIAQEILKILEPHCLKIQIAGSIRRKKSYVGDIEILYIPKQGVHQDENELFPSSIDLSRLAIKKLIGKRTLALRIKSDGTTAFGERVKLLTHLPSGIALDCFACTHEEWFNNLVSRTGGKENNITIASAAIAKKIQWLPFGLGFKSQEKIIPVISEEDVFHIVELPYLTPEERL